MSRWTRRHITASLRDSGSAHNYTIGPWPGDFVLTGLEEGNLEALETMDQGDYDGYVYGDQKLIEWTATIELPNESLTHAAAARFLDWALHTGMTAGYTSPDSTVWAPGLVVTLTDGVTTTTITLGKNRIKPDSITVAKEGTTVSVSGRSIVAPVIT